MLALCAEHHAKADAGAFTKQQLRAAKDNGRLHAAVVSGRLEWMRRQLLAIVGGNYYFESDVILRVGQMPIIWFGRDSDGYLLLNIRLLHRNGQAPFVIKDNYWFAGEHVDDVVCPPSGRIIKLIYSSGSEVRVEFIDLNDYESAHQRYPMADIASWAVPFPITAAEVQYRIAATGLDFGPDWTHLGGISITNSYFERTATAIQIDSV
jgi:hypothetical protein